MGGGGGCWWRRGVLDELLMLTLNLLKSGLGPTFDVESKSAKIQISYMVVVGGGGSSRPTLMLSLNLLKYGLGPTFDAESKFAINLNSLYGRGVGGLGEGEGS